ncbi:MAG: hypothetical protein JSW58_13705, partial [Candidatus Latescibacterota bacterium]
RIFGTGEVLIVTSRVLSWVSGFLAILGMFILARALDLRVWTALLCALFFATHVWFVRWTALSMETASAVLAIVAVGVVSVRSYRDHRNAWLLGFTLAAAALLRPESYLLVPVYLAAVVLSGRTCERSCVFRTLLLFSLMIVPWLAFAKYHIGSFLPNTAGAKSGGMIVDPIVFVKKFLPIAKIVGSAEGMPVLAVLGSLVFFGKRSRVFSQSHRLLFLWVLALPIAYVLFDVQVLSRYMLLTSPFTIVLGFSALEQLVEKARAPRVRERLYRWVPGLAALAAMAVNVFLYATVVIAPSKAFSYDLTHNLRDLALFVKENSSPGDVVAAADIGYLAFYSERRVLDLGGLVDNETHRLREVNSYEEIVEKGMYLTLPKFPLVHFFIDRELSANRFDKKVINGYRFDSIMVTQVRNLGIKKPGPYFYTLYRLTPLGNARP